MLGWKESGDEVKEETKNQTPPPFRVFQTGFWRPPKNINNLGSMAWI